MFQTPVPNYKDVDLSFSYDLVKATFDFAKMDQTSGYDFTQQVILSMSKLSRIQLSSPQIHDFIRLGKF
jgi:hypothetical protein